MASFWDNVFTTGEYGFPKAFTEACPASAATNQMLARIDELQASWQPTGYYTWQDMSNLLAAAVEMSSKASSMAVQAFSQNPSDILRRASDEYMQIVRKANEDYQPAWQRARTANAPVNAPGFKTWVIDLLKAAHKLARVSEISVCTAPWWLGVVQGYMYYFNKVVDIAKTIGHVLVKAGEVVVDAAEGLFSLWPVLKWGGLAVGVIFGGVYLWNRLQYTAERAHQPVDWSAIFDRWKGRAVRAGGYARGRLFRRRAQLPAGEG